MVRATSPCARAPGAATALVRHPRRPRCRPVRGVLALLGALVLLPACSAEPDDVFFWFARLRDASGPAVSDGQATLVRSAPDRCRSGAAAHWAAGDPRKDVDQETSNEQGEVLFEVMRYLIQRYAYDSTGCFRVGADFAGGGRTEVTFLGEARDIDIPDLVRWDSNHRVEGAGATLRVVPPTNVPFELTVDEELPEPDPTQPQDPTVRRLGLEISSGAHAIWEAPFPDELPVSPWMLEDFPAPRASAEVVAEEWLSPDAWGPNGPIGAYGMFPVRTRSQGLPLSLPLEVPLSRGAACVLNDQPMDPCPATDGKPELIRLADDLLPVVDEAVRLTLPRAATVRRLVLRGAALTTQFERVPIEGSADAIAWTQVGLFDPQEGQPPIPTDRSYRQPYQALVGGGYYQVVPLTTAAPIRYLRLKWPYGAVLSLREISVFE